MFKQLSQIERLYIETSLNQGMPIGEIAKMLKRPVTTISREIKRNRVEKKYQFDKNQCDLRTDCRKRHACGSQECSRRCNVCHLCNKACASFVRIPCKTRDRSPHCCNGCTKKSRCFLDKCFYLSSPAQDTARDRLSTSRAVIQITDLELEKLNQTVSRRIKQGQPIYHILASSELPVSESTMYRYINSGILNARNIDLPRKVGMRIRTGRKRPSGIIPGYRINRTYDDYLAFMEKNPDIEVAQMDLVEGSGHKNLLTFTFVHSRLLLAFLIPDKTQASVTSAINELERIIGHRLFRKAFKVVLTDNGTEFQNHRLIEFTSGGVKRCRLYYCDPYASWQKGACEKNHTNIRLFLDKGTSFDALSQSKVDRMLCNINSVIRKSTKEDAPFNQLSPTLTSIVRKLGLVRIHPENVTLRSSVLK